MSAFDGLLNGLIAGVGGAAGTGADILQKDRDNLEREKQIQMQADITEKKQQALMEFQQSLAQTSADQNAARQRAYDTKAGQDIEDSYQFKRIKDANPDWSDDDIKAMMKDQKAFGEWKASSEEDDRSDMLRAKADIAERLGYKEHSKQLRDQQRDLTQDKMADAAMLRAEEERQSRMGGVAHAPAEAQMVEFIASKVLGDTSQAGYKKAFALVKQSKGKSSDEQRANLAASLIKSQYMKPDEANRIAGQLFPDVQDESDGGTGRQTVNSSKRWEFINGKMVEKK